MSAITKEFTKEQLQQIIETDHVQCGEASSLARIALASLETEPVCVIDQSNLDYLKSGSDADVWPASRTEMGDVLLYRTAPPAPVSVPAAMEMDDDFDSAFEHGKAVGWNAYRAAMLQSFGNSEQLNSPVIPDGWVACSERMPPPKTGVIVGCWFGRNWATKWATYLPYHPDAHQSGFLMPGGSWTPTHWMPLPAAPQQEVKS
ncbi:DUF551 domain-containing protein [Enterobacter asburiae]|uniref:DUF551 domain-containing protein n=1 Tax=Enterobacter asburiae TaxID=61645 RepID=UPI002549DA55|nr:DUF551 domain-containing protein [Enterobacter asburiae]MDK9982182.1 DUF551 domain-containing protein [Enterobacter asburiae]MDK9990883.1 DUF551 domain-containing protein [Enterobacter asburiae]